MYRSIPVGIKDSNEAELIAVIRALELSSTREECTGKRIIIESDSTNVINRMIKESNRPWKFYVLFILASRFSSGLRLVKYSNILREGNSMTDALTKQGFTRNYELMTWF
jgi:ribonuclease HI